jgi:hypothetical protein
MSYFSLGSRRQVAAADRTGRNTGNLTAAFLAADLNIKVSQFELYHMAMTGIPSNTVITVYQGQQLYTVAQLDTIGDWDPAQPMLLEPAQEIYLFFNIPAASTIIPIVTCWFRFDPMIGHNT